MNIKQKLRTFFRARESSDAAVELLKKFIIPFSRGMKRATVDDVIAAFFAINDRKFYYLRAKREFKLPGRYFIAGNKAVAGAGPRTITKGKVLLAAVDRVDGTVRVEVVIKKQKHNFLLERFEFETISDWVEVISGG